MIVSTKGRYALRVMIDLVQHGLLQGLRGKGGGYRLTRPAANYRISDILLLTEGSLAPVACLEPGAAGCARLSECRTYQLWRGLDEVIRAYLDQITLADLARPAQSGDHYMI